MEKCYSTLYIAVLSCIKAQDLLRHLQPIQAPAECFVCRLLQQMQPILIQRGKFRGATGNINIQRYYADVRSRAATQEVERYLPKCRPIPRITRNRISRCSTLCVDDLPFRHTPNRKHPCLPTLSTTFSKESCRPSRPPLAPTSPQESCALDRRAWLEEEHGTRPRHHQSNRGELPEIHISILLECREFPSRKLDPL